VLVPNGPTLKNTDQARQGMGSGESVEPHRNDSMPDDTHLLLMELTIQFALAVARADGPVVAPERELIRKQIRQRYGYNRALLNRAEAFYAHYELGAIDLEGCLRQVNAQFTEGHRIALLHLAVEIFTASGKTGDGVTRFLNGLARRFGVPSVKSFADRRPAGPNVSNEAANRAAPAKSPTDRLPSVTSSPVTPHVSTPQAIPVKPTMPKPTGPGEQECLVVLDIPPGAPWTADLVRRQWNLLSARMAPEKAAGMGPEFVKLAESKLASIRQAAEILLGKKGEKLEPPRVKPPTENLRPNADLDEVFGGM